jgi:cation diffusion facilitator family transporter
MLQRSGREHLAHTGPVAPLRRLGAAGLPATSARVLLARENFALHVGLSSGMSPLVEQRGTPTERATAVRRVLVLTLVANLLVAAAKVLYGYYADALAMRADGFHSLTDASNNVLGLVSVAWAARPADRGHPYGHQRFELVAAACIGLLLLLVAYDVVKGALERWLGQGAPLPRIDAGVFVILGVTLAINVWVAAYEARKSRELGSSFLASDAAHTQSDVAVTLGVLLSAVVVRAGYAWADVVAAIVVAGFVGWAGFTIVRRNFDYLVDHAQLESERVEAVVRAVPGVAGAHRIRTRGAPGSVDVDLHIQIAPHLDVVRAHEVTHWVIDAVKAAFPEVREVLVHTEPAKAGEAYAPLPAAQAPGTEDA